VVVVVADGWQLGQPAPEWGGTADTAAASWQAPQALVLTFPAAGVLLWHVLQVLITAACAGTSCGNPAVPAPWHALQLEVKPALPGNAPAWLPSTATATNTATATITSATIRIDIFFIVTSLPLSSCVNTSAVR
jgi:hypothetical protein